MRVGSLGYCTDQGISHLMRSFFDNGVVNDPLLKRYPRPERENHPEWYPPGTKMIHGKDLGTQHHKTVREWMLRCDVLLFFETPFDWKLLDYARTLGKKTAIVTMYEWWPESPPSLPDLFLCPSLLDLDVFTSNAPNRTPGFLQHTYFGREKGGTGWVTFLPVPAPAVPWTRRTTARRFLHNAGHVGSRNHKGTDTLLLAMNHVQSPLELTVTCQDAGLMLKLKGSCGGTANPTWDRIKFVVGNRPYDQLFPPEYDVYVAPERYNGLSLPLQEAFASGMTVCTTDRYPANTWLPRAPMVVPDGYSRVRVAPGHLEIDEAQVCPRKLAAKLDELYGSDVSAFSEAGRAWAEENSWANLGPRYRAALDGLL